MKRGKSGRNCPGHWIGAPIIARWPPRRIFQHSNITRQWAIIEEAANDPFLGSCSKSRAIYSHLAVLFMFLPKANTCFFSATGGAVVHVARLLGGQRHFNYRRESDKRSFSITVSQSEPISKVIILRARVINCFGSRWYFQIYGKSSPVLSLSLSSQISFFGLWMKF